MFSGKRNRYDIALSYASEDAACVRRFKAALPPGVIVFDYEAERAYTWGRNMYARLEFAFAGHAEHVIPFISEHYARKPLTRFEFGRALAVASGNPGYLLPVRLDDTPMPGLPEDTVCEDLRRCSPEALAELVVRRLAENDPHRFAVGQPHRPASDALNPILLLEVEPVKEGPVSRTYRHDWPFYQLHARNVGTGVARSISFEPVEVQHTDFRHDVRIAGQVRFKPIGNLVPGASERLSPTSAQQQAGPHLIGSDELFTFFLQNSAGGEASRMRIRYEDLEGTPLVQEFSLVHNECVPGTVMLRDLRPDAHA